MINAEEARKTSEFIQKNLHAQEMRIIEKAIGFAIDKGETSCSLDFYIDTENKTKLETLGYKVERICWQKEDYWETTLISW